MIDVACSRLRERAAGIADSDLRKRFLCDVPVHARALQLAITWTGAMASPPRPSVRRGG